MRLRIVVISMLILALLAACNGKITNEESKNIEPKDIRGLVNDYSNHEVDSNDNTKGESASITSTELIITDSNENELIYDVSKEEFFVSIAPFINETHPCTDHSLTGCQGELVDKDFDLYIEDMDGNAILDKTMNSGLNGFIDLWLPRDQTYNVKIIHEGKQVDSEISTFENDGTCITTMQLM